MTKTYSFRTIIDRDDDGSYYGSVPALAGCQTWGWPTLEKAQEKLREAIDLYLRRPIESSNTSTGEKRSSQCIPAKTSP